MEIKPGQIELVCVLAGAPVQFGPPPPPLAVFSLPMRFRPGMEMALLNTDFDARPIRFCVQNLTTCSYRVAVTSSSV